MAISEFDLRLSYVKKYGTNSFSTLLLYDDITVYMLTTTEGFIGYRNSRSLLVVIGEPICAAADYRAATEEFIAFCSRNNKQFMFVCCGELFKKAVETLDFSYIRIGEDFIFDVSTYAPKGDRTKMIRLARNQALRAGATVKEYDPRQQPDVQLESAFSTITEHWLKRNNRFKAHLMGLNIFDHRELKRYFYAEVGGRPVAFMVCLPIFGRNGLLFEDAIRGSDAPYGIVELLALTIIDNLQKTGGAIATFGISPRLDVSTLTGPSRVVADVGMWIANRIFSLSKLYHFRKKFYASIAEPSYLFKYPKGLGLFDLARILTSF
jgi:phosphatidylglycerol lysyltransferase